jgi:enamine deaminase RidA (YjgF/YER057c/UK114 family)
VKGPCKFIFIAGQTPCGDNYEPMAKGDYKKQYERVIEGLTIQLKAALLDRDRSGGDHRGLTPSAP